MFQPPCDVGIVSLKLSEVLADMGLNENIVTKRRRNSLLYESIIALSLQHGEKKKILYHLGSQSEGTTTLGLKSDNDLVILLTDYNVIQDLRDWEPGLQNYLMIQDETVSPGYCLLQRIRDGVPFPSTYAPNANVVIDKRERVLLKTASLISEGAKSFAFAGRRERQGPALSVRGLPGIADTDYVFALPCKTWPQQARQWLDYQDEGQDLTGEMRRYCSRSGCFVVAVGSKGSANEELEWRISTSLAERCLMFNLNMTQIRCYLLMKMILKEWINPSFKDNISSFMCKCILFHCIKRTDVSLWRENRLLECFSLCIKDLFNCILNENCPHFIIPENNLMRGHISPADKPYILDILREIINIPAKALLALKCDTVGEMLELKLTRSNGVIITNDIISGQLILKTSGNINEFLMFHSKSLSQNSCQVVIPTLRKHIRYLVTNINRCQGLDKEACYLLIPWLCATLGSALASLNIQLNKAISTEAFTWISMGLNTDVASSKLKLASMLYSKGDTQRAETVLMDIERNYEICRVEPVCSCYKYEKSTARRGFNVMCDSHYEEAIRLATAFCVRFLPCEINCVPTELQHEMFRSTQEDLAFRDEDDFWMDWAVVDSLPYQYFLQYKIYRRLGKPDMKKVALSNLFRTTYQEPNLGHRETALNLLGQCMEQQNRAIDALRCYSFSLRVRERNNAAKLHICILLSKMIHDYIRMGSKR